MNVGTTLMQTSSDDGWRRCSVARWLDCCEEANVSPWGLLSPGDYGLGDLFGAGDQIRYNLGFAVQVARWCQGAYGSWFNGSSLSNFEQGYVLCSAGRLFDLCQWLSVPMWGLLLAAEGGSGGWQETLDVLMEVRRDSRGIGVDGIPGVSAPVRPASSLRRSETSTNRGDRRRVDSR